MSDREARKLETFVCKMCGGVAIWCDTEPDEDGHYHDCDIINCTRCNMSYTLMNDENYRARFGEMETFEGMRDVMRKVYNGEASYD